MRAFSRPWWPFFLFIPSWLGVVILTWPHGLPFFAEAKYIPDIQYYPVALSWLYSGFLAASCASFLLLARISWQDLSWKFCFRLSLIFAFLSSLSLPANSGDFFSYIEFARLIVIYGLSPYTHGYNEIEDLYRSFSWFGMTSNYSPLALALGIPAALASELNVFLGFAVLKLTVLVLAITVLVLLKKSFNTRADGKKWFILFALNPLWLLEVFINGHNDIVGVLLLVVILFHMQKQKLHQAAMISALLPLFKTPLGVVSGFFGLAFLRRKDGLGVILTGLSLLAALTALVGVIGDGDSLRNFAGQSAPLTANSFIGHFAWVYQVYFLSPETQSLWQQVIPWLSRFCALGVLAFTAWQGLRKPVGQEIMRLGVLAWVMVYIFATQFWPWYGLWVLPFVIFAQDKFLWRMWVISVFGSLILYTPLFWQILADSQKMRSEVWEAGVFFIPTLTTLAALGIYLKNAFSPMVQARMQGGLAPGFSADRPAGP